MTFNIGYLLAAVVLLWLPLPLSLSRSRIYKYRGQTANATVGGLLRAWQNWADLVRSSVGAFLLLNYSMNLADGEPSAATNALYLKAGILVVGVLAQSVRFTSALNVFAPLFYLTGLTAILSDYTDAGFAILFAWTFAIGARAPRFQLPAMGGALMLAAFFLDGLSLFRLLNCALIFTPLLLATLFQKSLLFISRERKMFTEMAGGKQAEEAPKTARRDEPNVPLKSRPSIAK